MDALASPDDEARLVRSPAAILLSVLSVEERDGRQIPVAVDVVARRNAVVTVHAQPVSALREFESHISDEATLGRLDAASFMGGLVDTMLGSYRRQVEEIEEQVDRLDEVALRGNDLANFLERVVALRRRAATLRRILVPQRETSVRSRGPTSSCTRTWGSRGRDWLIGSRRRSAGSSEHASCWSARRTSIWGASASAPTTS